MRSGKTDKWLNRVAVIWCKLFHDDVMWPVNGQYQCRRCLTYHRVCWDAPASEQTRAEEGMQHQSFLIAVAAGQEQ
jgi:hypothetical protein